MLYYIVFSSLFNPHLTIWGKDKHLEKDNFWDLSNIWGKDKRHMDTFGGETKYLGVLSVSYCTCTMCYMHEEMFVDANIHYIPAMLFFFFVTGIRSYTLSE